MRAHVHVHVVHTTKIAQVIAQTTLHFGPRFVAACNQQRRWPGKNKLGEALMDVRRKLRSEAFGGGQDGDSSDEEEEGEEEEEEEEGNRRAAGSTGGPWMEVDAGDQR